MKTWHSMNKSKEKVDTQHKMKESPITLESVGTLLEKSIEDEGGEVYQESQALTKSWIEAARSKSSQIFHTSAVSFSRVIADLMIDSDAPPYALAVLGLSLQTASRRLMNRAYELDPKLEKDMKNFIENAKNEDA